MDEKKAAVRQQVEKIDGVSRTWLEWTLEKSALVKTLVVEVDFDTDPNSSDFRQSVLDAIESTAIGALQDTTMVISHLRIIPKGTLSRH